MGWMDPRASSRSLAERVERSLRRCLDWSQAGRHRRVLGEVERLLPCVAREPRLEARLLVWKAQALLSMGFHDRALTAARRSWDLEVSPHACHLMASALYGLDEAQRCEEMLRDGVEVFEEAVHLPIQLAMVLADQGRLPEALEVLENVPETPVQMEDMGAFVAGFRANLLATLGRWTEAEQVLRDGLGRHPDSDLLHSTRDEIDRGRRRSEARSRLLRSWRSGLGPSAGDELEVDREIVRCGAVLELTPLHVAAARRLWRALFRTAEVRPQAPDAWATAMLLCVLELDGDAPPAAAVARATRTSPDTVRAAARRTRELLDHMSPELRLRAFAAEANPRLDDGPDDHESGRGSRVVPFPGAG